MRYEHSRRYHRVTLDAGAALTCAGDAAATWKALSDQQSALMYDESLGWVGKVSGAPTLEQLAVKVARHAWQYDAEYAGIPALSISASKGDIEALCAMCAGDSSSIISTFPGSLTASIARALEVRSWQGASIAAACSTGLYSLLSVADVLEEGGSDHGMAGAADRSLHPFLLAGFRNMGVLCGASHPQKNTASPVSENGAGFAPAEGAGCIMLRTTIGPWRLVGGVRLADAGHETHFRDPQTLACALNALWSVLPHPDLIVVHGTGTVAGDAYEQQGLRHGPWSMIPQLVCKPIIGHCLGASGLVELIAAMHGPAQRIWKVSLGFGGHLAAVAVARE